jgi:hypothetical protein
MQNIYLKKVKVTSHDGSYVRISSVYILVCKVEAHCGLKVSSALFVNSSNLGMLVYMLKMPN